MGMYKTFFNAITDTAKIKRADKRYGMFEERSVRQELADKYDKKYFNRTSAERLLRRRNVSANIKEEIHKVLQQFITDCPFDTGNGRRNGIRYKMLAKNTAIIQIGGYLAPYLQYLSYAVHKWNIHIGWIEDTHQKCVANLGEDTTLSDPIVYYGEVNFILSIMSEDEIESIREYELDDEEEVYYE